MERAAVVQKGRQIIQQISPDFRVLNGPFQGLCYPNIGLQRSSLPARIIGSYENQLHPYIQRIIDTPYKNLIEIGSAEGYYAVGLGQKMPETTIHCYDTDTISMDFCRLMAEKNNVSNLTFNSFCSQDTLRMFAEEGRGFVFSDCEGYELELFTSDIAHSLRRCDLLIELHDVFHPGLSQEIIKRFQNTHWIEKIDNSRQEFSDLKGLELLSDVDRVFALCEHRGGLGKDLVMDWVFLTAKQVKVSL